RRAERRERTAALPRPKRYLAHGPPDRGGLRPRHAERLDRGGNPEAFLSARDGTPFPVRVSFFLFPGPCQSITAARFLRISFARAVKKLRRNSRQIRIPRKEPGVWTLCRERDVADHSFSDFIRRIRAGDEAAAAELVRKYEAAIRLEVRM